MNKTLFYVGGRGFSYWLKIVILSINLVVYN